MDNFLKWASRKQLDDLEVMNKTGGGKIAFLPIKYYSDILKYRKRTKSDLKIEPRASYTAIAIF